MKQVVTIGGQEVAIRGVKYRELKEFSGMGRERIESLFSILDEEDLFAGIEKFLRENLESVGKLLVRFTDLTEEQVEDLELSEMIQLGREMIRINGIDSKKVTDFFMLTAKELLKVPEEAPEKPVFAEPIPMTASMIG